MVTDALPVENAYNEKQHGNNPEAPVDHWYAMATQNTRPKTRSGAIWDNCETIETGSPVRCRDCLRAPNHPASRCSVLHSWASPFISGHDRRRLPGRVERRPRDPTFNGEQHGIQIRNPASIRGRTVARALCGYHRPVLSEWNAIGFKVSQQLPVVHAD